MKAIPCWYIESRNIYNALLSHNHDINTRNRYITTQCHITTSSHSVAGLVHRAAITPSTPATPAKLIPNPAVACAGAAPSEPEALALPEGLDDSVDVEVPVASPCEFVMVETTVDIALELIPELDPEPEELGVADAEPEEPVTDPELDSDPVEDGVASSLTLDAAEAPALEALEATPSAPETAVDAAPSAPLTAVEATPSAPVMALFMPSATSAARMEGAERRRSAERDLRCIFDCFLVVRLVGGL